MMDFVRCSKCGKQVSNKAGMELVVRAWVECPECIEGKGGNMTEQELRRKITEIMASALSDVDVSPRTQEVFNVFKEAGWTSPEATKKLKEHIAHRTGQLTAAEQRNREAGWVQLDPGEHIARIMPHQKRAPLIIAEPEDNAPDADDSRLLTAEEQLKAAGELASASDKVAKAQLAKDMEREARLKQDHQIDLQMQAEEIAGKCRQKIEEMIEEMQKPCPHWAGSLGERKQSRLCVHCWQTINAKCLGKEKAR